MGYTYSNTWGRVGEEGGRGERREVRREGGEGGVLFDCCFYVFFGGCEMWGECREI